MAKSAKKSITVTMTDPKVKTRVTRYDGPEDNEVMANAYLDKRGLKKLGDPAKVKITIEAA